MAQTEDNPFNELKRLFEQQIAMEVDKNQMLVHSRMVTHVCDAAFPLAPAGTPQIINHTRAKLD